MSFDRDSRLVDEPQKEPPDPRTSFQRDRDRILYAPEFRRLAAVTQVASSHETLLFHNRLTHTLKVAQMARRIAERLASESDEIDADVVEAAALAHDIGHPPFGHIAEARLDELVVAEHVADGFEGNAQSFRIVTRLSTHTSGQHGLNLTIATLRALTKYPWQRGTSGKRLHKYGAYSTEDGIFEKTRRKLPIDRRDKQTAEATIMDWADDVAYALHDLDDFYLAGLVPLDRLARDEVEQQRFLDLTRKRWVRQHRTLTDAEWQAHEHVAEALFKEFPSEREPSRLMRRLSASKANLFAGGLMLDASGVAVEDPDMRMQLDLLKSLTWTYVIESPGLAGQQAGQRRVIEDLYEYFLDATTGTRHVLPVWAQDFLADEVEDEDRKRIACDVVASLTEAQAFTLFATITGNRAGSLMEALQ